MKKKIFLLLFFCSRIFMLTGQAPVKFDFSGVDQLWQIINSLQQDLDPSTGEWETLFKTPGYAELMFHEPSFSEDFFKKYLRIAYKPSLNETKQTELDKSNRYVKHFMQFYRLKDSIESFQKKIRSQDFFANASLLADEYLAPGSLKNAPPATFAFILFDEDARGYSPMIFDMIYALHQGKEAPYLFAHEMHHHYRNLNLEYNEGSVRVTYQGLFLALNWIQQEGIADQIDKLPKFYSDVKDNSEQAVNYRRLVDQTPDVIAELDKILQQMEAPSGNISNLGWKMVNKIPRSGHPTGFYMTRKIVEHSGKQILAETSGNPFAFLYLYNIAAKSDATLPLFSNKSIIFLREIEKKYVKNPRADLARLACTEGFDFSGIGQFWELAKIFDKGKTPTDIQWEQFFSSQGYSALFNVGEADRNAIQQGIISAYGKVPDQKAKEYAYFSQLRQSQKEWEQFAVEVEKSDVYKKVMSDVTPFVPQDLMKEQPGPTFCFLFGLQDFKIASGQPVWDLVVYRKMQDEANFWMTLHAISYYLDRSRRYNFDEVQIRHDGFLSALMAVNQWGAAQCMTTGLLKSLNEKDKPASINDNVWNKLQSVPQTIKKMDSLLCQMDPIRESEICDQISGLIMRAQVVVGYYMLSAIHKELGEQSVNMYFGNPFRLLILYNEAARNNPGEYPEFSPKAMAYMGELEKMYGK